MSEKGQIQKDWIKKGTEKHKPSYRLAPLLTRRFYVHVLNPEKRFSDEIVYIETYYTKHIPRITKENKDEYLELGGKLYDDDILGIFWREAVDPKLNERSRFSISSEDSLKIHGVSEWKVAGKETIKTIAIGILERLLRDPDFKEANIRGDDFSLSKAEEIILRKADAYSAFRSLKSYSRGLLASQTDVIEKPKTSDTHHLSDFKKKEADEFAESMGIHLEKARAAGINTTRTIAAYFNYKNIPSALGGKWSASSVSKLIKRRQMLDLENIDTVASQAKKMRDKGRNYHFTKMMGTHLEKVRKEGISSTRKIAEKFNELGLTTKTGASWSNVTVHKLIKKRIEFGLE